MTDKGPKSAFYRYAFCYSDDWRAAIREVVVVLATLAALSFLAGFISGVLS